MNATNTTTVNFYNGWVDGPNGRGTVDVLWSCLVTIFIATYTALHLNLPSEEESAMQIQLRKIKWMTAAVLVPEVVTASAFAQYIAARDSVVAMKSAGCKEWTMRHSFFFNMGGIWLKPRDSKAFPINTTTMHYLIAHKIVPRPTVTEKEIWDRSKADRFAKIFACFQIGWLVLQCIGRVIQTLPVTPLEIATIGFAIPSLATFMLWFNKPMDIEVPILLPCDMSTAEILESMTSHAYSWRQTPLDFITTINVPSFTSEVILKSTIWPNREYYIGPATRIRNDVFALKYSILNQLVLATVWMGYAGIHLSAWTYDFPSTTESICWRVTCFGMAASMVIFWIVGNRRTFQLVGYLWPSKRADCERVVYGRKGVSTIQILLGAATFLAYLAARLCLIALTFACLRRMPVGVFSTVNWANFLPHI